ncbi:PAC2 family-domain-containing protein [Mycena rebaudengoi]|nr:PAC2 family-domain-containing protein [Mycena rebaudengoi]
MVFLKPTQGPVELKGKALIVPVVSTANVSQLAADLLIASLSLQRVGIFDSGLPQDGPGVCTPLELYGRDGSDVVVVQQRSPVLKSCKHEFIDALLQFIESSGVASVLFLSGVDLSNRTDAQMVTGPSYQLRPTTVPLSSTPLARLETLPIPVYSSPSESEVPFIPGGSLTRRILQTISKTQSTVPTAAILQFVLEASVVVAILGITVDGGRLIEPQSWKQGLFGAPPDQTLYG